MMFKLEVVREYCPRIEIKPETVVGERKIQDINMKMKSHTLVHFQLWLHVIQSRYNSID